MAIDKGLYAAPLGIQDMGLENEPDIEIEIEDPESVNIEMDGLEIELREEEDEFDENLVDKIDASELAELANDLLSDFARIFSTVR